MTIPWWQTLMLAVVFSGISIPVFYIFSVLRRAVGIVLSLNAVLWLLFALASRVFLLVPLN